LQRKTPSIEAVRIADSRIGMFTAMRGTWLYSRYVDNPNKVNKLKLQEKNFKLEKLKFDYQIRCLSMKLKMQISC